MSEQFPAIQIRVPATSANLGCGFDSLAVAFNLWNQTRFEFSGSGFHIKINGEGEGLLPVSEENLIFKAFQYALKELNIERPDGVQIQCENNIPLGSGLGSSAAAVLTGVMAAASLQIASETRENWLQLSADLEGHADNVAAAIYGGLTAVRKEKSGYKVSLFEIEPDSAVLVLPLIDLPTNTTRAALPKNISTQDAIHNLSRIPAILEGFHLGDSEILRAGFDDKLHHPYRLPLIPGSGAAIRAADNLGAAATLSGAGPSIIAFLPPDPTAVAEAMGHCFEHEKVDYRVINLTIINRGALISRV